MQQLIRYGIREANKHPTAPHKRDRPEPLETWIPNGILVVFKISPFTDSDVWMAEVQSAAAVKMNTVARIARHADARNASVCLTTPITSAKNVQMVPMRMRYDADRVWLPMDWLSNEDVPLMIKMVSAE